MDGAPGAALRDGRQLRRAVAREIGMERSGDDHEQGADDQAERKNETTGKGHRASRVGGLYEIVSTNPGRKPGDHGNRPPVTPGSRPGSVKPLY